MWLVTGTHSFEEFSLVCLNAVIATAKVSGSLAEKDSRGWINLREHQSGCWSVNQTREGHQTQAAPDSWCSLKVCFPLQSPISANNDDIKGLQQQLDTFGIHRQLLSEEQPSRGFISAALYFCTYPCQQVGGSRRPAGWHADWRRCVLWACRAVEGKYSVILSLGFCFNYYWAKVCLTAYLTLMWSHNETYRGDLGPDVTFALH